MSGATKKSPQPAEPFDLEGEQALLGAILLDNAAYGAVAGTLKAEHFYEPLHQRLYEAIATTVKSGRVASPLTLRTHFEMDVAAKDVGGGDYLASICRLAPSIRDAGAFAQMVLGYAARRAMMRAADDLRATALDMPLDWSTARLTEYAEQTVAKVGTAFDDRQERTARPMGDFVKEAIDEAQADHPEGQVKFGMAAVDAATGGARAGEFIVIAGRPGMGKTAVGVHMALRNAEAGIGTEIFSMEMRGQPIGLRLAAAVAYHQGSKVAHDSARRGTLTPMEVQDLLRAEAHIAKLPLYVHDGRGMTPSRILLQARQLKRRLAGTAHPLKLVIVDHLQKIIPDREHKNPVSAMTEITGSLQMMAGELDVVMVGLCQLNREAEKRPDKRPQISDLRESGSIEQDADMIALLYREAYYHEKTKPHPNHPDYDTWYNQMFKIREDLDIHLAKQRHGAEGTFRVAFDGPSSAIKD